VVVVYLVGRHCVDLHGTGSQKDKGSLFFSCLCPRRERPKLCFLRRLTRVQVESCPLRKLVDGIVVWTGTEKVWSLLVVDLSAERSSPTAEVELM
jgi:hypothetical protein